MSKYIGYMIVMAGVTYLVRMLPITLFQKQITNVYIKSFLYYVPYAVLGCMTFPAIFTCTGNTLASCIGCLVGVVLAYKERSLLQVAIGASVAAYLAYLLVTLL